MKPRLAWVLLAVSVAFNVFFAIGFWSAQREAEQLQTFEGRARLFTADLNLTPEQQATFDRLLRDTMAKRAAARKAREPLVDTLLAELNKENPDEAVLLQYAETNGNTEYRRAMVLMMRDFVKVLNSEQKQRFLESFRQRATETR